MASLVGTSLLRVESGEEPWLSALAVRNTSAIHLVVANLCATTRVVHVVPGGAELQLGPYAVGTVDLGG
jgi:hypothetical protein